MFVFEKHIKSLIKIYGNSLVIVNLVEQHGRELCLGEAFLQVLNLRQFLKLKLNFLAYY